MHFTTLVLNEIPTGKVYTLIYPKKKKKKKKRSSHAGSGVALAV